MRRYPTTAVSAATARVRLELHALYASFDAVRASPTLERFKFFCQLYRVTLLIWLRRDREALGAFDKWVKPLVDMGDRVIALMGTPGPEVETQHAITRHRDDFRNRLAKSKAERAAADSAIQVKGSVFQPSRS